MFVYKYNTGWWFGIFVMFHNIWDVILPIDFMFQDGFLTTKQCLYTNTIIMCFYSLTSSPGGSPGSAQRRSHPRSIAPDRTTSGSPSRTWKTSSVSSHVSNVPRGWRHGHHDHPLEPFLTCKITIYGLNKASK
jgi:hypothetical protein